MHPVGNTRLPFSTPAGARNKYCAKYCRPSPGPAARLRSAATDAGPAIAALPPPQRPRKRAAGRQVAAESAGGGRWRRSRAAWPRRRRRGRRTCSACARSCSPRPWPGSTTSCRCCGRCAAAAARRSAVRLSGRWGRQPPGGGAVHASKLLCSHSPQAQGALVIRALLLFFEHAECEHDFSSAKVRRCLRSWWYEGRVSEATS